MTDADEARARIERELARLGADDEPPAGWEARVVAAIADQRIEAGLAALGAGDEPPAGWEARVVDAVGTERIAGELARLGEDDEPPPGWQARVLAATAAPKRRWWWFAIPAPILAAATAVVVMTSGPGTTALQVAITTERADPVMRTRSASDKSTPRLRSRAPLGDTLRARASGGGDHRAIWIYRGETELVAACPGTANCRTDGDAIAADVALALPGTYNLVILTSADRLGAPAGTYDHDVAAAKAAGAAVLEQIVDVN